MVVEGGVVKLSMSILSWLAVIAVGLCVLLILFVRWHLAWVAQQTPVGSWISTEDAVSIKMIFEGGPLEGTYKEVVETEGELIREFGHWSVQINVLNLIVMASDVPEHSRIGIDTPYQISYVGPESIRIEGPDRPNLLYTRADGIAFDFDSEMLS